MRLELASFSRSSSARARSFSTTSGGAFVDEARVRELPLDADARSCSTFGDFLRDSGGLRRDVDRAGEPDADLEARARPPPRSPAALRAAATRRGTTALADVREPVDARRALHGRSPAAARSERPISTSSSTRLERRTFISPRTLRIASTIPMTGRSPAPPPRRPAPRVGYCAA